MVARTKSYTFIDIYIFIKPFLYHPSKKTWIIEIFTFHFTDKKTEALDVPDDSVVKHSPAHTQTMGLIPDPRRSHMPWGN